MPARRHHFQLKRARLLLVPAQRIPEAEKQLQGDYRTDSERQEKIIRPSSQEHRLEADYGGRLVPGGSAS